MTQEITDVAIGIAPPIAQNLGALGLIIVLGGFLILGALVFLLKYSWDKHAEERKEWKEDANKREERATQAIQSLTDALRYTRDIDRM